MRRVHTVTTLRGAVRHNGRIYHAAFLRKNAKGGPRWVLVTLDGFHDVWAKPERMTWLTHYCQRILLADVLDGLRRGEPVPGLIPPSRDNGDVVGAVYDPDRRQAEEAATPRDVWTLSGRPGEYREWLAASFARYAADFGLSAFQPGPDSVTARIGSDMNAKPGRFMEWLTEGLRPLLAVRE